jgi:hypothetical protein
MNALSPVTQEAKIATLIELGDYFSCGFTTGFMGLAIDQVSLGLGGKLFLRGA